MRRSLTVLLLVLSVGVALDAQRSRARRIRARPPAPPPATVVTTTFDCPAASFGGGSGIVDNDTICPAEAWVTGNNNSGPGGEITAAANYSGGGGGRGFRHYRQDGTNINGGGLRVCWPDCVSEVYYTELWFRFHMRYQSGFAWNGGAPIYTKDWYLNAPTGDNQTTFGFHSAGWGFAQNSGSPQNLQGAPTWSTVMGGTTGDGLWHCYQMHIKIDTGSGNGVWEAWVDGVAGVSSSSINHPNDNSGLGWAVIGSNQNEPSNGGATVYTDYDDIAVSITGMPSCL